MKDLIKISDQESTELLKRSGPAGGMYVPLSSGPDWLALDPNEAHSGWAVAELAKMRAEERALAGELNLAVETRLRDDLHELLAEEFADEIRHERLDLVGQRLADQLTTAVFEAMQAAGFNIVRKAG